MISLPNFTAPVLDKKERFTLPWKNYFRDLFERVAGKYDVTIGGNLSVSSGSVGNVGTGEDDLLTYTLPANTVDTDGSVITIEAFGTYAANANNKTVKLYFGSTAIYSTEANAANNGAWYIKATIIRTGAAAQKVLAIMHSDQSTVQGDAVYSADYTATTESLTASLVIKCTGEATSNNDVTQEALIVSLNPAI